MDLALGVVAVMAGCRVPARAFRVSPADDPLGCQVMLLRCVGVLSCLSSILGSRAIHGYSVSFLISLPGLASRSAARSSGERPGPGVADSWTWTETASARPRLRQSAGAPHAGSPVRETKIVLILPFLHFVIFLESSPLSPNHLLSHHLYSSLKNLPGCR